MIQAEIRGVDTSSVIFFSQVGFNEGVLMQLFPSFLTISFFLEKERLNHART